MGSWLFYGLGADTEDLPGFVVLLSSGLGGQMQPIAARQWSAGLLPSKFQGVKLNSIGDPVLYIQNPSGINANMQRESITAINALNRAQYSTLKDPEIQTRIAQYEMAFKMQTSVPGLVDMSKEPKTGVGDVRARSGAMARSRRTVCWPGGWRSAACGFIQLYHRDWDHHGAVEIGRCAESPGSGQTHRCADHRPEAAWHARRYAGDLGRGNSDARPCRKVEDGRDHHIKGFSFLLAGGGIKGGITYGTTDDLGYAAEENPVSIHDFHATMLHLLGVDHKRLAVKFQGLDVRLTGISGDVVKDILV